jgi:hypothetical protein
MAGSGRHCDLKGQHHPAFCTGDASLLACECLWDQADFRAERRVLCFGIWWRTKRCQNYFFFAFRLIFWKEKEYFLSKVLALDRLSRSIECISRPS